MNKYKLIVEYDGFAFNGWQRQKNARSVQDTLIKAAVKVTGDSDADIQGSGRTDAGVHALGQCAHLMCSSSKEPGSLMKEMNDELPNSVNILSAGNASPDFHARHSAVSRSYIYQISTRRTAFGKNYVWWVKENLDLAAMENAGKLLLGMHNFTSFANKLELKKDKSPHVLIESFELKQFNDLTLLRFKASHFLWKMVRRLTGVLTEIGRGALTDDDLRRFLKSNSKEPAGYTAPPSGLYLEKVYYDKNEFEPELKPVNMIGSN